VGLLVFLLSKTLHVKLFFELFRRVQNAKVLCVKVRVSSQSSSTTSIPDFNKDEVTLNKEDVTSIPRLIKHDVYGKKEKATYRGYESFNSKLISFV